VTGDVDPADPATGGSVKSVWTVEHGNVIYGDVLVDSAMGLE